MASPAQQPEDYPGVCTTLAIKLPQSADRRKPIWRCTQDVKTRSLHRIYLSESLANGANEWLLNGYMSGPPTTLGIPNTSIYTRARTLSNFESERIYWGYCYQYESKRKKRRIA